MTAAKQVRAQYTQEFKLEAVRQVSAGQAIAVVAKVLGIPKVNPELNDAVALMPAQLLESGYAKCPHGPCPCRGVRGKLPSSRPSAATV